MSSAAKPKVTFEVQGTVLVLKVKTGGRESTWKFRNSLTAEKWWLSLIEVVGEIEGNGGHTRPLQAPTRPVMEYAEEDALAAPPEGPPPLSEEQWAEIRKARIAAFTTNDGVNKRPGIYDVTEDGVMALREVGQADIEAAAHAIATANAAIPPGARIVSPNDPTMLPKTLDG